MNEQYTYKHSANGDSTTLTRKADGTKIEISGSRQLNFMRAVAYVAGEKKISGEQYSAKIERLIAAQFEVGA